MASEVIVPTTARRLASYTDSFGRDGLSDMTMANARMVLLDTLGCALAALKDCNSAAVLQATVEDIGGRPEATIFGSGLRTNALNALLVNGALVRYLDCNDGFIVITPTGMTGGHPSDAIPMILALAERQGKSGADTLTTIVLAYQLYGRLATCEERPLASHGWTVEAICPLFTPLIAGKMLGLTVDQLEQAVGISGTHGFALGILDTDGEEYGMTKNIRFGRMAYQGVMAAYQAARGFTGTRRVIEGHFGWNEVIMNGGLQIDRLKLDGNEVGYLVDEIFIKMFSADGSQLGHLSATYQLISEHDIHPDDIAEVRLKASRRCVTHCAGQEKRDPRTKELADHSVYYTTAALIARRSLGPSEYTAEVLGDPKIRSFMNYVSIEPDVELDSYGAAGISEIILRSGPTFKARVDYPRGHPKNPMAYSEVVSKFMALASPVVGEDRASEIETAVADLQDAPDIASLMELMTLSNRRSRASGRC